MKSGKKSNGVHIPGAQERGGSPRNEYKGTYKMYFSFLKQCSGYTVVKAVKVECSSTKRKRRAKSSSQGASKEDTSWISEDEGRENGTNAGGEDADYNEEEESVADGAGDCGSDGASDHAQLGEGDADTSDDELIDDSSVSGGSHNEEGGESEDYSSGDDDRGNKTKRLRSSSNDVMDVSSTLSSISLRRVDDIIDESSNCSMDSQCSGTVFLSEDSSGSAKNASTCVSVLRVCVIFFSSLGANFVFFSWRV